MRRSFAPSLSQPKPQATLAAKIFRAQFAWDNLSINDMQPGLHVNVTQSW